MLKTNTFFKKSRASFFALITLLTFTANAAYYLDNSVEESGVGTSMGTAFKSWNDAWKKLSTLGTSAKAVLYVVASENPYLITNTPPALAGGSCLSEIKGINSDGTLVSDPSAVVVDGQNTYYVGPLGSKIQDLTVSGITFRNAKGSGTSLGASAVYGSVFWSGGSTPVRNTFSNCVFENCSGSPALAFRGHNHQIVNCTFKGNKASTANSIWIYSPSSTAGNAIKNCIFEGNGGETLSSRVIYSYSNTDKGYTYMSNCTFKANAAKYSIVYCDGVKNILIDTKFISNTNTVADVPANGVKSFSGGMLGLGRGTTSLTACSFENNVGTYGACYGGRYNDGYTTTFKNCNFSGNIATYGGTIAYKYNRETTVFTNCTFNGNDAGTGEKSLFYSHLDNQSLSFLNCSLEENTGAAIVLDRLLPSSLKTTFRNSVIANNKNSGWGATATFTTGALELENCTITNNTQTRPFYQGYSITAKNCLFAGNKATGGDESGAVAGLIKLDASSTILNCTFVDNSTANSLIYSNDESDTIKNCLFYENSPQSVYASSSYSYCFSDWTIKSSDDMIVGSDPKFVNKEASDYQLRFSSPCRDKGDSSPWTDVVSTDLAGNNRILEGVVDIGCYEFLRTVFGFQIYVK